MEKLNYPYEPGVRGINFEQIFNNFQNKEFAGQILGCSGERLSYAIDQEYILVRDIRYPGRVMDAIVVGGMACFNLKTKKSQLDKTSNYFPWDRHPDMFARQFVSLALAHFERNKQNVVACKGNWETGSDNLAIYLNEYEKYGDSVRAARATPAGKIFIANGFQHLALENISYEELGDGKISQVTAFFHKEKPA
jgi:hypothetical protein